MLSCHTAFVAATLFIILAMFNENTACPYAGRRMILILPLCLLGGVSLYAISLMTARSMTLGVAILPVMSLLTCSWNQDFKWSLSSMAQACIMTCGTALFYAAIGAHTVLGLLEYGYCATMIVFLAISCDRNGFFLKQCYRESPLLAVGAFLLAPFVLIFIALHYAREERAALAR